MQHTHVIWKTLLFAVLWQMTMAVGHAQGVDLLNLQQNMPMRMQDAYAIPDGTGSVDLAVDIGENCRCPCRSNWGQAWFQVEYGVGHGWQGTVGMWSVQNDYDETGDGDIYLEVLKQLYETPRDALAVQIKLDFPTGQNHARIDRSIPGFVFVVDPREKRVDYWLGAIYTRLLDTPKPTRLHAQAHYGFINSAPRQEPESRWFLALGADHQIARRTLLMANLWWEGDPHPPYCSSTVLQLGLRQQQTRRLIWGGSLNLGLAPEPMDIGGTLSAQYGF